MPKPDDQPYTCTHCNRETVAHLRITFRRDGQEIVILYCDHPDCHKSTEVTQ